MAPIEDRTRLAGAGEQRRLVKARQEPIAERQRGDNHRSGASQRPQLQTQVGIIGNPGTRLARRIERGENAVARAGADGLADTRHVQHFRIADQVERHIGRTHAARRRTGAKVTELVPAIPVSHEVDAGRRVGIRAHATAVDVLALPEPKEFSAEGVVAQAGDVGGGSTQPRGSDNAIRGVAAKTLQI